MNQDTPTPDAVDTVPDAITTQEHAEAALMALGELTRQRQGRKADAESRIAQVKEDLRVNTLGLDAGIKVLEAKLKGYAKTQQRGWEKSGRRSATLTHGEIGYRRVTIIRKPKDEAAFLQALRDHGLDACIRVYSEPNIEELEKHDDATLEAVGCRRVTEDRFYAKARTELPDVRPVEA